MKLYSFKGYDYLTPAQLRVVRNLSEGKLPGAYLAGMGQHGGLSSTLISLRRRGILDADNQLVPPDRVVKP